MDVVYAQQFACDHVHQNHMLLIDLQVHQPNIIVENCIIETKSRQKQNFIRRINF